MRGRIATVIVTRFAPSPTGALHLGHAKAALFASDAARAAGGRFMLRIEDIDVARCRAEHEQAILDDLAWLGLAWEAPVRRQSEHFDDYAAALADLGALGVLYPCRCTRAEIRAEIARSAGAPQGALGDVYPGTCRRLGEAGRVRIRETSDHALRLDVAKALALTGPLTFEDEGRGRVAVDPAPLGDVVLARKETPASYHLAVTVDDALQGVSLVTRGEDLLDSTHVHRLLQALLRLPVPRWHHHGLVLDESGRRLAKRDGAPTLRSLRDAGVTPEGVRERLGAASPAIRR
jgi:glutamyl-Q tRNA(Asp) synthetase